MSLPPNACEISWESRISMATLRYFKNHEGDIKYAFALPRYRMYVAAPRGSTTCVYQEALLMHIDVGMNCNHCAHIGGFRLFKSPLGPQIAL